MLQRKKSQLKLLLQGYVARWNTTWVYEAEYRVIPGDKEAEVRS